MLKKLKTFKVIGSYGDDQKVDWSGFKKDFTCVILGSHEEQWAFVSTNPSHLNVEVAHDYGDGWCDVVLLDNLHEQIVKFVKKPYKRKTDGKSYPNVQTSPMEVRELRSSDFIRHGNQFGSLSLEQTVEAYNRYDVNYISFGHFIQPRVLVRTKDLF